MSRSLEVAARDKQRIVLSVLAGEMAIADAAQRNKVSGAEEVPVLHGVGDQVTVGRWAVFDRGRCSDLTGQPYRRHLLVMRSR